MSEVTAEKAAEWLKGKGWNCSRFTNWWIEHDKLGVLRLTDDQIIEYARSLGMEEE